MPGHPGQFPWHQERYQGSPVKPGFINYSFYNTPTAHLTATVQQINLGACIRARQKLVGNGNSGFFSCKRLINHENCQSRTARDTQSTSRTNMLIKLRKTAQSAVHRDGSLRTGPNTRITGNAFHTLNDSHRPLFEPFLRWIHRLDILFAQNSGIPERYLMRISHSEPSPPPLPGLCS